MKKSNVQKALSIKQNLITSSKHYGVDVIGFTGLHKNDSLLFFYDKFKRAIELNYHAELKYLSNTIKGRFFLDDKYKTYKSAIVCGFNYYTQPLPNCPSNCGIISQYAWGNDYHTIIKKKLIDFTKSIQNLTGTNNKYPVFVDSGGISEKSLAICAGLGWMGKNSLIINPTFGSFMFLGIILVDFELEYDHVMEENCKDCSKCIKSCPTNAIIEPYVLDANRCISYLTVEHKGEIDKSLSSLIGNQLFGCDLCQIVCPYNKNLCTSQEDGFKPRPEFVVPTLDNFLNLCENHYPQKFKNSPLKRIKQDGLIRNCNIVRAN